MTTELITVTHRCKHTTEQAVNPGAADKIREVGAMYICNACRNANPFAVQRKYGRGRGGSR